MRAFLLELYARDPVLAITGWIHAGLFLILVALVPFDDRTILGLNPWIKPIKFAMSITIYVWTIGWLLGYLSGPRLLVESVRWGVAGTMLMEMVWLIVQAARGTTSHFNTTTPLDAALFGVMGMLIAVNTLLVGALLIAFWTQPTGLPPLLLWGIRLGLLGFLLGSAVGPQMIANMAHTVGAPDGGPGLPFVNWSTVAGDLRVAHFLGLHALQVFPLVAAALLRLAPSGSQWTNGALAGFIVCYTGLAVWTYLHALAGQPLLAG